VTRPERLVVVTATGTEVGKTWWTAASAAELRRQGITVSARKPVQSFDPEDRVPTDAEILAAATGEGVDEVCPPERSFPIALAPPMAARRLARTCPTITELVGALDWPDGVGIGFVEGVGGPRSPLAADGDTVDLVAALQADRVVVVADAALGAVNAVLLTVAPFAERPVVVALNRFDAADPLHEENRAWLTDRSGLTVVTSPVELATSLSSDRR
jgi:dethiobiotin synthetase